jgi:hypothetical protein
MTKDLKSNQTHIYMGNTPIAGIIRTIMAALSAILLGLGVIKDPALIESLTNDLVTIAGGVVLVGTAVHSVLSKIKAGKK